MPSKYIKKNNPRKNKFLVVRFTDEELNDYWEQVFNWQGERNDHRVQGGVKPKNPNGSEVARMIINQWVQRRKVGVTLGQDS